jgi:PAS domain S-box-containing protein
MDRDRLTVFNSITEKVQECERCILGKCKKTVTIISRINGGYVNALKQKRSRGMSTRDRDTKGRRFRVRGLKEYLQKHKQMKQQWKESEECYRNLLEFSPEPIAIHQKGKVVYINPAGLRLMGADSKEEIIGRPIFELVHPTYRDVVAERVRKIEKNETVEILEEKIIRLDGQAINIEVLPVRITYMGEPAVLLICRDITERKRVEQALRENEANYRIIEQHMTDLIGILDIHGMVSYVSPSCQKILGELPEYCTGKFLFERVHPEDFPRVKRLFFEMIRSKTPRQAELRCRHADGHWITMEANGAPVIEENGEVSKIVFVARDITERKSTEELLRKADKLSLVGELAAGVAHEIRNPLTALKGFVQLLQAKAENNPDYKPEYFEIMLSELDRIHFIVNEFMLLAKPQVSNFQPKDIRILMQHVVALLTTQAIMNDVQILTDFESDLPMVTCEENQLKQVFVNILKNAIEAMPHGGILRIQMKMYSPEKVLIRFVDQGCGIPEELIPKLGNPFFTTKEQGTGLGLMVCFKIIETHKGCIHISSEKNKGTTVDIILPVQAREVRE